MLHGGIHRTNWVASRRESWWLRKLRRMSSSLGTGASQKTFQFGESKKNGEFLLEAEYSLEYLQLYFDNLVRFDVLGQYFESKQGDARPALSRATLQKIVLDTDSNNTHEEIYNAGIIFAEQEVDRVFLVSSPSHMFAACETQVKSIPRTKDSQDFVTTFVPFQVLPVTKEPDPEMWSWSSRLIVRTDTSSLHIGASSECSPCRNWHTAIWLS